ncbi:MAG: hypothetical protein RID53_05440 [Coleofasciculus sp. B1-GNL1-01]|uniref:hypothetical protein n=1 Tax=Coleofasciculus sp. B1-GNL1-01 TaxID=3068484 RepID=UPI0032FEC4AA
MARLYNGAERPNRCVYCYRIRKEPGNKFPAQSLSKLKLTKFIQFHFNGTDISILESPKLDRP